MQHQLKIRVVYDRTHVATLSTDPNPRPGLIQLESRYNGRKVYRAIASVYLDQFGRYNKKTHTTTGETVHDRADAERINQQIQQTRASMLADFDRCQAMGLPYSLDRITRDSSSSPAFLPWAQHYIDSLPVAHSTRLTKQTYIKTIAATGLITSLSDLTASVVLSLDQCLRSQQRLHTSRPLSPGYIHNVHTFLHTLSVEAQRQGYISADPYKDFHNPKAKPSPRPFLTAEQIALIANAPCIDTPSSKVSLKDARDLFLLQVFTGLAYIDVQCAPWSTARATGILQAQRRKTRTAYMVRISPAARAILDRWGWVPPRVSSMSLNESLQLIVCQAVTGLAEVGLRTLHQLPPHIIDALRSVPISSGYSAQNDTDQVRALLLLLLEIGVPYDAFARADLMAARRTHTLQYTYRGHAHDLALNAQALHLLDLMSWTLPSSSRATITNTLRRLIAQSVIPHLSTHIGRHTFGTIAINAGVPVAVLQRIMGHSNPNTTLIYAKLQPDTILDAFSLIDPETDPTGSK